MIELTKRIRITLILSLVAANIGCDQISKTIVRQTIETDQKIEVFKENLILTKVENRGAAYSIGADLDPVIKTILLQIAPILVLLYLLRQILIKTEYSAETIIGMTFIIGGGIGNILDRILYQSVTDFLILDIGIIKSEIFNLADVSIMIGSLVIISSILLNRNGSIV
ncbi:signal peptidase II [Flavobacteriaceae bacterium (ex Bugula neritina AB1)]|nr:signal peptidase II [Flavobacteriaceae bacterium (ex Bugula neritina AB1)]